MEISLVGMVYDNNSYKVIEYNSLDDMYVVKNLFGNTTFRVNSLSLLERLVKENLIKFV